MDDNKQDAPLQSDHEQTNNQGKDPADQLTPEHPRFKEVLDGNRQLKEQNDQLSRELAEIKSLISQRQDATGQDQLTQDEEAALARIEAQLSRRGYVKKADLEETQRVEQRARKLERLSDKYDGTNGSPKFVRDDVVVHAAKNGFGDNLEAAFKDMHYDTFVQIEAKKRSDSPNAPHSERPNGGERKAGDSELTEEQVANMSDEEYAKNRDKLLKGIKPH